MSLKDVLDQIASRMKLYRQHNIVTTTLYDYIKQRTSVESISYTLGRFSKHTVPASQELYFYYKSIQSELENSLRYKQHVSITFVSDG